MKLEHSIECAISRTKDIVGNDSLEYLDHGMEGVILTDGIDAYKYFINGKMAFRDGQLDFIRRNFLNHDMKSFVQLKEIHEHNNELIFRMELFDGEKYQGVHFIQLITLLRECKANGVVHRNLHPKNILVHGELMKVCDIGHSIMPYTPSEFREMAKRAFLVYRYHFRQDLSELMRSALHSTALPELEGFDVFFSSLSDDMANVSPAPLIVPPDKRVSLLIKASPVEWQTVEFQIKHIVKQLNFPPRFCEVVVITDRYDGPFRRQYAQPDHKTFKLKLESLMREGWIDKVIYAPMDPPAVKATYKRWFNVETTETHAEDGQHTYTTLYGIDRCNGDFILQMDGDCLIARNDFDHDFIGEMVKVIESDPKALTVAFKIAKAQPEQYSNSDGNKSWRMEVRCSLFKKERLNSTLPLPNALNPEGKLRLSWHRAVDLAIADRGLHSYRGGDNRVFFIHVPNSFKTNVEFWHRIVNEVEKKHIPAIQYSNVDLVEGYGDWF